LSATTHAGRTALHVASAQGQSQIVDILLESGMYFDKDFCHYLNHVQYPPSSEL